MKIWIDITNAPHVNFFKHLIDEMEGKHELIITCRDLSNTIPMLDMFGIKYSLVGKHYGASNFKKAIGFFRRLYDLYIFLKNKNIDVSISHSSFYSPVVSRLLGIRSIYMNDNEHALGNIPSYIFCNRILIPEAQDRLSVKKQWGSLSKVRQYPGVKEAVYLWSSKGIESVFVKQAAKNKSIINIYIRPEPWAAQYYTGSRNFLNSLIVELCGERCKVILLPRGEEQRTFYEALDIPGFVVQDGSLELMDVACRCDLFIGAGGTMTREMAVLGVPTISTYQGQLLNVDEFLINLGFMIHDVLLDKDSVMAFYRSREAAEPSKELLDKGRLAYQLIKDELEDLPEKKR